MKILRNRIVLTIFGLVLILTGIIYTLDKTNFSLEEDRNVIGYRKDSDKGDSQYDTDYYFIENDIVYLHRAEYFDNSKGGYVTGDTELKNSDPSTFEIIDSNYAKDKENVYYWGHLVEKADPETFETLDWPLAQDKSYIFEEHKIKSERSAEKLKPILTKPEERKEITQEDENVYWLTLEDDPNTIKNEIHYIPLNKSTEYNTLKSLSENNWGYQYWKYKNNDIGISFIFRGDEHSYIQLTEEGKLWLYTYSENLDEYVQHQQDVLEIFKKDKGQVFENAVKEIVKKEVSSYQKCVFKETEEEGQQRIRVSYGKEYMFNKDECEPNQEILHCNYVQKESYTETAISTCSAYIAWPYDHYFIYQPENNKELIIFNRHRLGLDASPWLSETIKLF